MKSHIFNNELLAAGGKKVTEWRERKRGRRENRGVIDRYEQIITRPLSQCVRSVTLQRWHGREEINGLLFVDP